MKGRSHRNNAGIEENLRLLQVSEPLTYAKVVSAFRHRIRAVHPDLTGAPLDPDVVTALLVAREQLLSLVHSQASLMADAAPADGAWEDPVAWEPRPGENGLEWATRRERLSEARMRAFRASSAGWVATCGASDGRANR